MPFVFENDKWKCTLNSPEAVEGLEYYLDIYKSTPGALPEGLENLTAGDQGNLFLTSKSTMGFAGITYIIQGIKGKAELADKDISMLPLPSKEGIPNSTLLGWVGFGVFDNHDAEKAKYAQLFVRYFAENAPDILTSLGNMSPVRKSTPMPFQEYKDNVEIQYYLTEFAQFGKDFGAMCPVYQAFKGVFASTMQGVFTGELTAKAGLDEVVSKTNKLLDEFYAK